MCGIAGIVAPGGRASVAELGRMTDVVSYRGPDDQGYLGFSVGDGTCRFARTADELQAAGSGSYDLLLGHRRLSILDLSENGRCPMPSADRRLWITYNGEIYNYIELRAELAMLGHRFTSGTDTEVILAAYRQWGTDCLRRFNGMWAFALLDVDNAVLFCARDRLGVKPFYYHWDGATFSFGSEIKQLLGLPRVTREAHAGVLFDFLVFGTYGCNSEQTFYRDVTDMRGGHYLKVPLRSLDGWTPKPVRWWDIDLRRKEHGWTDAQYAERYRELFEDAVRLRLRSDVPLGTCLSGGLDSSGIVCTVDRLLRQAGIEGLQKTFTSVSDNPRFDERDYAQAVIEATRVQPAFVNPSAERLLAEIDRLMWHQEEPFISTSIFAGWCVYGLAREHGVTVTLDGQGPDEMLGGYVPTMYRSLLAEDVRSFRFSDLMRDARGMHDVAGLPYGTIAWDVLHEAGSGLLPPALMPSIRRARAMLSPGFLERGVAQSVVLQRLAGMRSWRQQVGGTLFDQKLYQATFHDSLPGILRQVDRNSMAFSIESRLPFLDYRLVEYTFSLPDRQKFDRGIAKQVYRRAMSGLIPDVIRDRRSKLGFVTAESDWLREHARAAFAATYAGIADDAPYRASFVRGAFDRFLAGKGGYDPLLWKVFNLERMRAGGAFRLDAVAGVPSAVLRAPERQRELPRRTPRVCMISPGVVHAVPRAAATARYLEDVHFIDMIGTADRPTLDRAGVHYHLPADGGNSAIASVNLQRLLRRIDPDVIGCHYGLGDHFFHAIAYNRCPVAVVAMGTDVLPAAGDVRVSALPRLLSRIGLRRAGQISAKSRFLAAELARIGVRAPVDVNYWGCDLSRFAPGDAAAARARLGLPADAKIVLSPRALEPRLNIHLVVEAFAGVLRRWPDALLVVIGRADPRYRAQVLEAIAREGIGARVRLDGEVSQDILPAYYVASDLVVSAASSEGFPNTLLEVMACAVPVLVGDIAQVRELLADGVNARICPLSAAGLEAGMLELLADPAGAARMAAAGRATALEAGDIDRNGARWAAQLRELARTGRAVGAAPAAGYWLLIFASQLARLLRLRSG